MNEKLTRIYHTKISPELDTFGDNLRVKYLICIWFWYIP